MIPDKIDYTQYGLEETKATEISRMFKPMLDQMVDLEVQYNEVLSREIEPETIQMARDLRLAYVKVRTGTAKIHKQLKDFYLQGGRFVDGWKNAQVMASQGNEEKLRSIEDHFVNLDREKKAKLQLERAEQLKTYTDFVPEQLGEMDQEVWNSYIFGVKAAKEAKDEEDRLSEEEGIKAQKKEERRQAIIRKQNAALRKKQREQEEEIKRIQVEDEKKFQEEREKREKAEKELQAKRDQEEADEAFLLKEEQRKLSQGDKPKMKALLQDLIHETQTCQFKSKKYRTLQEDLVTYIQGGLLQVN